MIATPDLIVIGAGPAGSAAAITAARLGARVTLLERGAFPRHKVCGEFISPESIAVLRDLLGESVFAQLVKDAPQITQTRIYLDGATLHATIKPAALSVSRYRLDYALWLVAQREGVDCRDEITVEQASRRSAGDLLVTAGAESYLPRCVIDATGRWSNLRVADSAVPPRDSIWLGIKAHFATLRKAPASVDLYFFDNGYCGVQPVEPGLLNACAMVRASCFAGGGGTAGLMARVLQRHPQLAARSSDWRPAIEPVATSPLFFRPAVAAHNGILRVGDAAAFIDPFVGDGISLALRTGVLAAKCLSDVWRGSAAFDSAAAQYADAYRRIFAPVFRASARLRRVLTLPRTVRLPLLHAARLAGLGGYLVSSTRPNSV